MLQNTGNPCHTIMYIHPEITFTGTQHIFRYTIISLLSADSLLCVVAAAKHGQSMTNNHVYTHKITFTDTQQTFRYTILLP